MTQIEEKKEEVKEKALLAAIDYGKGDTQALISELYELAATAGIEVAGEITQRRDTPESATFLGSGTIEEMADFCTANDVNLIIFDDEITPTQQRNVEKLTNVCVIDRTELILDIFSANARSGEGRIQSELARYKYMLPRLSGQGKSLSRQGGAGMKRGSGESRLESDRRHIRRRIYALETQLEQIDQRRKSQRERRKKSRYLTVALVGYTNAGKSTIMNRLTDAGVLVEDKLFATLDPTARALKLPSGRTVMLIDTVGFIRKLPHRLVEAFKSTLEEAAQADLILNVCDASSPEAEEHLKVTNELLGEIAGENHGEMNIVSVFNKCDKLPEKPFFAEKNQICISAVSENGTEGLLELIDRSLPQTIRRAKLLFPFSEGAAAQKLSEAGVVHDRSYTEGGLLIDLTADTELLTPYLKYEVNSR